MVFFEVGAYIFAAFAGFIFGIVLTVIVIKALAEYQEEQAHKEAEEYSQRQKQKRDTDAN